MLRELFLRFDQALSGRGEFKEIKDVAGKPGIDPPIKLIAAPRVPEYGMVFDQVDDLYELSESSTRKIFLFFRRGH